MKRFNISHMNLKTPDYFGFYKMETKNKAEISCNALRVYYSSFCFWH